jgi:predicted Zn-dependent protease
MKLIRTSLAITFGSLLSLEMAIPVAIAEPSTTETSSESDESSSATTEENQQQNQSSSSSEPEASPTPEEKPEDTSETDSESDSLEAASPPHFSRLAEADRLYLAGNTEAAEKIYREVKPAFAEEAENYTDRPEPYSDPEKLSPAGKVYWRQAKAGWEQNLQTKILVPLELLVKEVPEFIPGHIRYAEALKKYERPEEAALVLEQAMQEYSDQPQLVKATVKTFAENERWLDASIAARQFALLYPEHPQAEEFKQLAEVHYKNFRSDLRDELTGNAIATAITGALSVAVTGSPFAALPAVDSTLLLLRGEEALGRRATKAIRENIPTVEDEKVTKYVQNMGEELAKYTGRDFEYEFHVILNKDLNAFALPGGKIFINAGAILETDSEAELAGLLAHELAHTVLSHGFQQATRNNLISGVARFVPFGNIVSNLLALDYSRDQERQADIFGTRLLANTKYAADGLRDVMATLYELKASKGSPPTFFSTHPDTGNRVRYLESLILRYGYNRYAYEGVESHAEVQNRVKELLEEAENEKKEEEDREDEEPEQELLDREIERWRE